MGDACPLLIFVLLYYRLIIIRPSSKLLIENDWKLGMSATLICTVGSYTQIIILLLVWFFKSPFLSLGVFGMAAPVGAPLEGPEPF
jgi:hypothetical protein